MPPLKQADIVRNVAKQTGLSESRAVEVIKKAGLKNISAYPTRVLSKDQQEKLVKNLPQAIKESGYKVTGIADEYRFKQKIAKGLTQTARAADNIKPSQDKKMSPESATDFLKKVRQGIPGSSEGAAQKQNEPVTPDIG